jgi:hypothetical protein
MTDVFVVKKRIKLDVTRYDCVRSSSAGLAGLDPPRRQHAHYSHLPPACSLLVNLHYTALQLHVRVWTAPYLPQKFRSCNVNNLNHKSLLKHPHVFQERRLEYKLWSLKTWIWINKRHYSRLNPPESNFYEIVFDSVFDFSMKKLSNAKFDDWNIYSRIDFCNHLHALVKKSAWWNKVV